MNASIENKGSSWFSCCSQQLKFRNRFYRYLLISFLLLGCFSVLPRFCHFLICFPSLSWVWSSAPLPSPVLFPSAVFTHQSPSSVFKLLVSLIICQILIVITAHSVSSASFIWVLISLVFSWFCQYFDFLSISGTAEFFCVRNKLVQITISLLLSSGHLLCLHLGPPYSPPPTHEGTVLNLTCLHWVFFFFFSQQAFLHMCRK